MNQISDDEYEYAFSEDDIDNCDDSVMDVDDDENDLEFPSPYESFARQESRSISPPNIGHFTDSSIIAMCSAEDIFPIMKMRVDEVSEILGIPPSAAMVLMREYKWTKEPLIEGFYSDPDKTTKNAGVHARCQEHESLLSTSTSLKTCFICMEDDFSPEDMISMPCKHEACRECWKGFVEVMIRDGPTCVRSKCPHGCLEVVTEEEVEQAAPELLSTYESFQVKSFVELSKDSRWCTGAGCDRIAVCKRSAATTNGAIIATCDTCTTCFCIRCGEEPHAPMTCRDLEKWNIKCQSESETANWILAYTKPCPFCNTRIEKNQGCNHMTCRQCRTEFCWICLGKWSEHNDNYTCNRFQVEGDSDTSSIIEAKRQVDRYLHYYERFAGHAQAEKFARDQLQKIDTKMALLQRHSQSATWVDVEFLRAANEQLIECRRVLKYSYAMAYLQSEEKGKEMQKQRFEYHQEMLERFTEKLSEMSEKKNIASIDRTEVLNQTLAVDCFTRNVLKYVEDGMDDNDE